MPESHSGRQQDAPAYLHYDYAKEKAEAWRLLGARIDAILTADNIMSLDTSKKAA